MQARISETENAIKIDGDKKLIRVMLDIQGGAETLSLLFSLIGQEFEITLNGHDDTSATIRYFG